MATDTWGIYLHPKGVWRVLCEEEIDWGGPFGWKGTLAPCTVCLG